MRRETPFGSDPKSGRRSLYRIDDPFLRLWFRVVAPHRAALAAAPRETRLAYWDRHRRRLEAIAWKELCRRAVPLLHRSETSLGRLGPWEPAQRYWRGNAAELDVVARSVDGKRLLVGEVKWAAHRAGALRSRSGAGLGSAARLDSVAGLGGAARFVSGAGLDSARLGHAGAAAVVHALFVPEGTTVIPENATGLDVHAVDARTIMRLLV